MKKEVIEALHGLQRNQEDLLRNLQTQLNFNAGQLKVNYHQILFNVFVIACIVLLVIWQWLG